MEPVSVLGEIIKVGSTITVPGVLLFIVIAFLTGAIVPKRALDDARKDAETWKQLATTALALSGHALRTVEGSDANKQ